AGRGPAAVKDIPPDRRADVIVAMGAQVRSFLCDAALHGVTWEPQPMAWHSDVPHVPVRELAAGALSGAPVRIPARLCATCTGAVLGKMADSLLDVMTAAGVPRRQLPAMLDWLAARAR